MFWVVAAHPSVTFIMSSNSPCAVSSPIRSSQPFSSSRQDGDINIYTTETTQDNGNSPSESGNGEEAENIVNNYKNEGGRNCSSSKMESDNNAVVFRRERPLRACALRSAKLYVDPPVIERRPRPVKRERAVPVVVEEEAEEDEDEDEQKGQCGRVVTPLVNSPPPGQLPRWNLRAMWELASILNFLNVFRPLLNISVEFSVEELESALITPNDTLSYIHIPILKVIPPVTRMACGRDTWVTVLCRKLKDWWHWVADGELPIVAARGDEIEHYRCLDPGVRVVILKALCDIRVEQEDIRRHIDDSMKHGVHLSAFRKQRMGGDSRISYWYEDDPIIGHRLYREIRKVAEVKRVKAKGSHVLPSANYEWETIATNLDEFQDVSEKLFTSKNRSEASVGKKLKNDMLPEIEKIHKRKEKLLKKQQREALLLDNFGVIDGLVAGRSLRDRKPVTYTFDAYDRSINEAIKITKQKQPFSDVDNVKKEGSVRSERYSNGRLHRPSHASQSMSFSPPSPSNYDDVGNETQDDHLGRRRRQRPQRYSAKEFVEALSDNDDDYYDSDDDIVGEVVYDEEYLRKRKLRKKRPPSRSDTEGDEEFQWSEENKEVEGDSYSTSDEDDSDGQPSHEFKKFSGRREEESKAKLWSIDNFQAGLRRSKRSTRNRMNFRQYELSESDPELAKPKKQPRSSVSHSDASGNEDFSMDSQDSKEGSQERGVVEAKTDQLEAGEDGQRCLVQRESGQNEDDNESNNSSPDGVGKERHFLDLNELAPGPGFDDGSSGLKDDDDNQDYDDDKGAD